MTGDHFEQTVRRHRVVLASSVDDGAFLTAYRALLADVSAVGTVRDDELARIVEAHAPFFRNAQQRYLAIEETAAADALLASAGATEPDGRGWSAFAEDAYRRVADLEQVEGFATFGVVVSAGSGALPSTLLWMADHHAATSYVGLDIDERCVDVATRLAACLRLTNVTFVHTDAAAYDYEGTDFVFVANQVRPKRAVLERIAGTIGRPVQVVVREPTEIGRLFAEPVDDLPFGYRIERIGDASRAFLSRDVFLRLG